MHPNHVYVDEYPKDEAVKWCSHDLIVWKGQNDRNNFQLVIWDKLTLLGWFALISELPFLKMEASESSMWLNQMLEVIPA